MEALTGLGDLEPCSVMFAETALERDIIKLWRMRQFCGPQSSQTTLVEWILPQIWRWRKTDCFPRGAESLSSGVPGLSHTRLQNTSWYDLDQVSPWPWALVSSLVKWRYNLHPVSHRYCGRTRWGDGFENMLPSMRHAQMFEILTIHDLQGFLSSD